MPELQDSVQETSEFNTTFRGNYDAAESQSLVEYALSVSEQTGGSLPAPEEQDGEDDEQDWLKSAGLSLGRDVSLGVMQAPRSIARGGIAGINSMIGFVDEAIDFLPTISILDKEGKRDFIPGVMSGSEFERRMNLKRAQEGKEALPDFPQIPIPGKPAIETVTGSGLEVISQFAVGFKGVDKLAKSGFLGKQVGDWIQGKGILPEAVKGALGELLAFDQHEERLANVLHEIPFLKGSVTEFLRAKPEDTFAEGKFKQAVEGFGLGIAGDALVKGVVLLKKGLAASGGKAAPEAAKKAAPKPGVSGEHFNFLGDVDGESLIRKEQKLEEAAAEVQAAFGKPKQIPSKPSPSIDDYEINFSRIDAPEDIKQLMDEMVNRPELKIGIDAARRGKKSHAETIAEAADIDGFESLMQRRTGEAYNAEYIVAGRKIYYDTTAKLIEAAKRAQDPNAGAVDQFNFRKMLATHHAVQKEFMGIRAEAGRALQAWRIPVGGSAPQNLRELEGILSHHGGSGASQELAQKLVAYGDHLNDAQINGIVQKGATARTVEALSEAWTLGLLTNPTTHVVNLASNVMTSFMLAGERFVMAAIPGSGVSVREGVSFFHGMMQSQKLAIKNMTTAFRTGKTGFGVGKVELPRVRGTSRDVLDKEGKAGYFSQALDGWGSILSKYAGGALVAGDEYSKTVLYQGQMYALATRQGIEQGLSGKDLSKFIGDTLQEVPEAIRHDAADFASYGTFTKELGKGGRYVQSLIALHPELRFIAPFVRTPANIFKFAAERTPLAFLARGIQDDIASGGVRRAAALSRVAMGTSVMAASMDMVLQGGQITGSGPSDPKARANLHRTGWKPYSIKIEDEWYSYSRFEPMATLMGFSADIAEIVSNYEAYDVSEQSQVDNLVAASVISMANQTVGKTFLSGFADTAELFSDPKRYGGRYLRKYAGSLVPAGLAAVERAFDPAQEEVFNMIDAMRARIPGISEFVPKRRNIWGEEIKYFYPDESSIAAGTPERILSLFNPVYYSKEKDAPLDKWMLQNGFSIGMPNKTQVFDDVRIDLRAHPHAYERLVELRGDNVTLIKYGNQTMKQFLTNIALEKSPYGRHMKFFRAFGNSFDEQQNFIRQVVSDYQTAAKEQVLSEFGTELDGEIATGKQNAVLLNEARESMQQ